MGSGALTTLLLVISLFIPQALFAAGMETTPFMTINQQPALKLYGFPLDSSATITPAGKLNIALLQEIASDYSTAANSTERLVFDGEAYRTTLAVTYGISEKLDAGINIPYLLYSGGFLDHFIIDWHNFFGMKQGGRNRAPIGAVNYSYRKNGVEKLKMDGSGSGIGDISLTAGRKLYADTDSNLSLRGALKLPTGDSSALRGSGSTDLALSLCASTSGTTGWGRLGLFSSAGLLAMTDGKVIADQQENLAIFGTLGTGWTPASWLSFKLQLNANSPLYRQSSLKQLASSAVMLTTGGTLLLPDNYRLDLGVAEDISVGTAPDVTFHFGLSRLF
jgi:hypothetical protein